MNKQFSIDLISDLDFEGMVVEISFDNQLIAKLNYDKGIDNLEIELILHDEQINKLISPLNDFIISLEKAKKILIQCAKEDRIRKIE